ncbi:thioredoxin domain-containing protein [Pacificimonas flava]|uniref:Periplasmic thiol:disulfide interchange protein DsbA n=1 Tax=Pacificimonas flava TaxID=1234595 RepID=M2U981_9SPHN|nr:thioredoxin domain-containing protein [Pacificimonas flava]EMD84522.1 Periplasmic thiol:disulfide interchange protein DsbA [Pacificimonas flava]MBB5279606.1 protein-disulfide isomerase [Pacificimonas flava]
MNTTLRRFVPVFLGTALLISCNQAEEATAANADGAAAEGADTGNDGNWVRQITKTPEGGYLMGNPDAAVKLVEFGSLACSHCADFHEQSMRELKGDYIASGDVSYELRTFVLNPADFVATAVARCTTPEAFYALSDAFFENQGTWLQGMANISQEDAARLEGMNPSQAMVEYGKLGGIDDFVRARGIPESKYQQCVSDESTLAEVEAIRTDAIENYDLTGTPTFAINGERIEAGTWPDVKKAIDAAL